MLVVELGVILYKCLHLEFRTRMQALWVYANYMPLVSLPCPFSVALQLFSSSIDPIPFWKLQLNLRPLLCNFLETSFMCEPSNVIELTRSRQLKYPSWVCSGSCLAFNIVFYPSLFTDALGGITRYKGYINGGCWHISFCIVHRFTMSQQITLKNTILTDSNIACEIHQLSRYY